jgi:hypothetical protein
VPLQKPLRWFVRRAGHPVPLIGTSVRPGPSAELDRYIGYRSPTPQAHDDLDADTALQEEVRNDARTLLEGRLVQAGSALEPHGRVKPSSG